MRFTDARNMDDETVTTAMEKLVGLASEDMLCCPETARNWHGYLRAFRDFEETVVEPVCMVIATIGYRPLGMIADGFGHLGNA